MLWHKLQGVGGVGTQNIVTDNLLLRLDAANSSSYSGTGTTWTDLGSTGRDGTLTNGPTWNTTYFDFDGDDQYVEMGTIPVDDPLQLNSPSGGGLTIMFAVWFDGSGDDYQRIIAKSDGGLGANGWSVYRNRPLDGNEMIFSVAGGTVNFLSLDPPVGDNNWQIWTITQEESSGDSAWYLNGSLNNSSTSTTYSLPNVQTGLRLATWNHTTGRELNGRIGFVMVYDKVLSSAEITQNFDSLKDNYGL